ncbi:MAG: anti-sigma factor [Actinobacteria bacterium]|nr:anti-sigma factor [Actinomycetota bacterium]
MAHCEPQTLSLIALGEQPSAEDAMHLVTCDTCRRDWESMRATVDVARDLDDDELITPPDHVWAAIAEEISADSGTLVPMRSRRRAAPWIALAAAVGVVLGGVVGASLMRSAPPEIVASVALEPLADYSATGMATVEVVDGSEMLAVDVSGLPATDGYFEVWLLAPDASSMIALGTLGAGESTVLPLPAGVSLANYPVVDISAEPYDGNPAHSTDSIVRGTLPA